MDNKKDVTPAYIFYNNHLKSISTQNLDRLQLLWIVQVKRRKNNVHDAFLKYYWLIQI